MPTARVGFRTIALLHGGLGEDEGAGVRIGTGAAYTDRQHEPPARRTGGAADFPIVAAAAAADVEFESRTVAEPAAATSASSG